MKFCELEKVYFWQNDLAAAAVIIVYVLFYLNYCSLSYQHQLLFVFPRIFIDSTQNILRMKFSPFLVKMEEEITFYYFYRYEI